MNESACMHMWARRIYTNFEADKITLQVSGMWVPSVHLSSFLEA